MNSTRAALSSSLHIGDTVLLSTQLRDSQGYVYKELSSCRYNFMTVYPVNSPESLPNIAFAAFRVLTPNKYQKRHELRILEGKQRKCLTEQGEEDELKRYEDALPAARKAVELERAENEQEQLKKFGAKVRYGDMLQLQHKASSKHMTANSEASRTEGNHLLVNLMEENSEGAIFKILPRYKVKSVGDEVHYEDQIKLESIKTPGQYLHTSCFNRTLSSAGIPVHQKHYELNLSASESSLKLIRYSSYLDNPFSLKAGDCVRFFHKQDECYIVAEGSFAESNPITENVHFRQRHVDQRCSHFPTSAITFWQIEKEHVGNFTSVISWNEWCRIKHMPSRLYLAVCKTQHDDKWEVTLKESEREDDDTLFCFHPLIQEGPDVLLESYALIQHLSSKRWLHLEKNDKYCRRNFSPNDSGLKGLQWDSAELYQISSTKDRLDYNAFTIQEVSADLIENFNYVAGTLPVFSNHLQDLECFKERVPLKNVHTVIDTLSELGKWLIADNYRETKNRQKLLRNLRILEQLIEILQSSKNYVNHVHHLSICRGCYDVLTKYLEGDSRKNENYLAQFIEFFQTQVQQGLNAEDLLVEIVQDNIAIVSRMAQTQMSEMIREFRKTKDSRFLDFLSSLCVCSGRPIPSTQDRLLQELDLRKTDELFLRTKMIVDNDQREIVVCYRYNMGEDAMEMSKFEDLKNCRSNERNLTKADFSIFEAQLHLFARLCKGNNKTSIDFLTYPKNKDGFVSFNEALLCAQNANLSFKLRSLYVELLLVMFIDVDENIPFLDNLCYTFVFDSIVANPYADTAGDDGETIALTGVENKHFPALKAWLQCALENSKICCDEQCSEENRFLSQIIDVLGHLVRYGYYDNVSDVDLCMKSLILLLDGNNDCPRNQADTKEFKQYLRRIDCPDNRPVFAIKAKVLEVLDLFYEFKFYVKLQRFIFDFKLLQGTERMRVGGLLGERSPPSKLRELFQLPDLLKQEEFLHRKGMIDATRNRLKDLCKDSEVSALQNDSLESFIRTLVDISCYESEELNSLSLHLLLKLHYFEDELFERAKQTQLLTSNQSKEDFKEVNKLLPKLRHLLRVNPDQKAQDHMIEILSRLCELCVGTLEEPNCHNQLMLYNFGIVSDILSYVLSKGMAGLGTVATADSPEVCKEVFKLCFCLLKNLAIDNPKIQCHLFKRVDELLQIKVSPEAINILADIADLLTEVFTGGPDLILRVSESQIERIFEIIVDCKEAHVQAQFMVTLQAIVKIEELNLPVKRNQEIIVKNFCRLRDMFCKDVLGEEATHRQTRQNILHNPERRPVPDPELCLLLSATDMLASCAEGRNLFIESVCQNIFSFEELIEIIGSQLPPTRKRPFIRFLIWVYMITADSQEGNKKSSFKHGNIMWTFLGRIAKLLEDITVFLQLVTPDESSPIRHELKEVVRPRSRTVSHSSMAVHPRLCRTSTGISSITGTDGCIKPGLFEYFVDGVIPLLHTYYSYFFDPFDAPNEFQKHSELDTSAQIFSRLMILKNELMKVFTVDNQIEMFKNTVQCFRQFPAVLERAGITNTMVEDLLGLKKDFLGSPQPRAEHYTDQQNLNDTFHLFCENYSLAYRGPNIAEFQIGTPAIDKEYSDPGEELPLGPHFQNLIRLYYNNNPEEDRHVVYQAEYLLYQLDVSRRRTVRLSEHEQEKQDNLDIRCLQVLRGLVHNRIKLLDPEMKERKPAKYRVKSKELFVPIQNEIQSFGCNGMQKIIPLLSHQNDKIAQEALALIKVMLFSGNEEVQKGIELNARETREETLFLYLKSLFEDASRNYKDIKALQSEQVHMQTPRKPVYEDDWRALPLIKSPKKGTLHNRKLQLNAEICISMETICSLDDHNKKKMVHIDADPLCYILIRDNSWITLVLEVVGLMCDGQNRALQDYLRDQPDNFKTVNVVAEVANFLHTYTQDLNGCDHRQINQILQTLIEICVGNPKNQQVIFDKLIVEPLNKLLRHQIDECHKNCEDEKCTICENILQLIRMEGSVVELLEIMLEETTSEAALVVQGIGYTIDMKALLEVMEQFHKLQSYSLVKEEEMDDDCERGMFRAYHIYTSLKSCKDFDQTGARRKPIEQVLSKCKERSLQVEIHYENEENESILAKVQFPFNQEHMLREEITEVVRWNINRDSMEDKHRALLTLMPSLKADIKHQRYLKKKKYWKPFIIHHAIRHNILLLLTFILNIFLLFLYRVPSNITNGLFIPHTDSWFKFVLFGLGSLHTFLAFWVIIEYFIINWPHFRLPRFFYKLQMKVLSLLNMSKDTKYYARKRSTCLDVNIFGMMTVYMIVFLISSILSLPFNGYFYPICLLYIIVNNDILQRVLRAVTKNGISLILVGILGIIVLFIYSVISFAVLHNYFVETDSAQLYCTTLAECMYSILRYGLLDNLGLLIPLNSTAGAAVTAPQFDPVFHFGRLIFDVSFFIIIITIGLNVVFGIIVDTFSQLREERSNVEDDQKSTCFICDLPSHEFDRKGSGFKKHVAIEHNMWNYVYYSVYLESIDTGDHNAIQKYVYEKILEEDPGFFPQEEARCLAGGHDSTDSLMTDLASKVNLILQHFDHMEQQKNKNAMQEAQRQR